MSPMASTTSNAKSTAHPIPPDYKDEIDVTDGLLKPGYCRCAFVTSPPSGTKKAARMMPGGFEIM